MLLHGISQPGKKEMWQSGFEDSKYTVRSAMVNSKPKDVALVRSHNPRSVCQKALLTQGGRCRNHNHSSVSVMLQRGMEADGKRGLQGTSRGS